MTDNLPALKAELIKFDEVTTKINAIVAECQPILDDQGNDFMHNLVLASGVQKLRDIFDQEVIKKTVSSMQDRRIGFLTDRSPAVIAASKNGLKAYAYDEVAECCLEALLNGYRITGNEFNVIAGNFYAAKNGKYRKIDDHPDVSNFQYANTAPAYVMEEKLNWGKRETVQFAKVQCYASWMQHAKRVTVGYKEDGTEDTCIFKIKVNNAMGDDAIVGKALSKLFSRVLQRIDGRIIPEAPDVTEADVIDVKAETKSEDLNAKLKESAAKSPAKPAAPTEKPADIRKKLEDLQAANDPRFVEVMMRKGLSDLPTGKSSLEELWNECEKEAK